MLMMRALVGIEHTLGGQWAFQGVGHTRSARVSMRVISTYQCIYTSRQELLL